MTVTYTFKDDLVRLHHDGDYTTDDTKQALLAALADPNMPQQRTKVLLDVTQSRSLAERSTEDIISVAEFFAWHADAFGGRLAILAPEGNYYGLMRMASAYAAYGNLLTKVFTDGDVAVAWLRGEDGRVLGPNSV